MPRPSAASLLACGAVALSVGIASARAPNVAAFTSWLLLAVVLALRFPVALIGFLAVVEPLQAMITAALPGAIRYFDEAIVLVMAAVVLGPRLLSRPSLLLRDRFLQVVVAIVLWNMISALKNEVPAKVAGAGLFVSLDYVALFLALRALPLGRRAARTLVIVVVGLGLAALVVGLAQHAFEDAVRLEWQFMPTERDMLRVPSLFSHPNDFGYYMLHATFVAVAAGICLRGAGFKVVAVACAFGVILSVSRSAHAALFLGLAVGALAVSRRLRPALLAIGLVVVALMGPFFFRALDSRIEKIRTEHGDARLTYAAQAAPILKEHFIIGVGPGRFGGEVARRFGSPVYARYDVRFDSHWKTVDSFWLHLVVESGFVGLLLFGALLYRVFRRARELLDQGGHDPWVQTLVLSVPMLVTMHALVGVSSMALEANYSAGHFWLILGTALSAAGDRLGDASRGALEAEAR